MSCAGIVIIGTGLAGYNLAKNIRNQDASTPITLLTEGEGNFYSKPLLSTALAQQKSAADLVMTPKAQMEQKHQLSVLNQAKVTKICPKTKTIDYHKDGQSHSMAYQKLVLAMGAHPKVMSNIPKHDAIFRINHLEDYQQFRDRLPAFKHIAIIGSGLVGCEFAHDLSHVDVKVSLITPETQLLKRWVSEPMAQKLAQVLKDKNIHIETNFEIGSVRAGDSLEIVGKNSTIQADAIIVATGLTPNIQLAKTAGIDTHFGIVVNEYCQTNIEDIYAIGDVMEHEGQCLQFVAPLLHQCQKLAQTLSNNPQALQYAKMPINLKTLSFPILHLEPDTTDGEWQMDVRDDSIRGKFYDAAGKLRGFSLGGSAIRERMQLLKELNTPA